MKKLRKEVMRMFLREGFEKEVEGTCRASRDSRDMSCPALENSKTGDPILNLAVSLQPDL